MTGMSKTLPKWQRDMPGKMNRGITHFAASKIYRWFTALLAAATLLIMFRTTSYPLYFVPLIPGRGSSTSVPYNSGTIDWSRFAYTQYVTNSDYLCNSVMFFASLHRLGSLPDRVIMYPSHMMKRGDSNEKRLLVKARDDYKVKLVPIAVQHRDSQDATWADSFTKLLAFNQTQYDRVLSIDSDSLVLQHMDELFLLPPAPVAMPRAYWLYPEKQILSSQVLLVQPSKVEFERVMGKINGAGKNDYDMEIVNWLYKDSAMVLPHRPYDMLTSEFRGKDHANYLGSDVEVFDPVAVYNEAKIAHFSDWPVAKPWKATPEDVKIQMQPACTNIAGGSEDCTSRIIWNNLYSTFRQQRKKACNVEVRDP